MNYTIESDKTLLSTLFNTVNPFFNENNSISSGNGASNRMLT